MVKIKKSIFIIVAVLVSLFFIGCDEKDVKVTDITVSAIETMKVGETQTITVEVKPLDATNKKIEWSSSDNNIITIDNGVVTAVAEGSATITIKSKDGNVTKEITITVEKEIEKISASNVKEKLQSAYSTYVASSKAAVVLLLQNGDNTLETKLSFELENELYKALVFEQKGVQEAGVYVKDGMVYMSANGAKQKYELGESENTTLVTNYGIDELLKKSVSYYNEDVFFNALTLTKEEETVFTFELDLRKYNGSVINTEGKDKIELIVNIENEVVKEVQLKITEGSNVNSITTKYLGFNDVLVYPEDLADYE